VLEVEMEDGRVFCTQRDNYKGFHTDPCDWTAARAKFDRVTRAFTTNAERDALADVIATLEERPVSALTSQLAGIRQGTENPPADKERRHE